MAVFGVKMTSTPLRIGNVFTKPVKHGNARFEQLVSKPSNKSALKWQFCPVLMSKND